MSTTPCGGRGNTAPRIPNAAYAAKETIATGPTADQLINWRANQATVMPLLR